MQPRRPPDRFIGIMLRRLCLVCLWPLASLPAADANALIQAALAAEARFDARTALTLFREADALRPNDPVILQKIARQYSDLSADLPDRADQRRDCEQALAYAQRAYALAPKNSDNVLSLAICYAKIGLYSDTRTKIENSRLVKDYAEQALALDPNNDFAHHVLGQWNYEVASVGAAKRFLVKLIYGALPPASTAEGVKHLRRAVELAPDIPAHHAELGLALLADGQREAGERELRKALTLPRKMKYDDEAQRRAREALEHLKP
jgi:tetratricopeptide (TPR) repeat protein